MRNASGHQCKVKMSGSEKKVNENTYDISSIKRVTKKFLEVSRCSCAKQRQRNVQKKCAARTKLLLLIGHLHDDIILIYYYDQNPSGFCFLVQIKAFVIQTSLGLP